MGCDGLCEIKSAPAYQTLAKYLELRPRIKILNLELQGIDDLFNMLASG